MPQEILGVKLYSTQETADLLGVTRPTLYGYSQKGRIKSTLIRGRKFYTEENIKKFLQTEK